MKHILKHILLFSILILSTMPVCAEVNYVDLMKNYEQGERLYKQEKANFDKRIKDINSNKKLSALERDNLFKQEVNNFYDKSRQLTAKYREPLVKTIQNDVNSGLPNNKKMKASAGTELYIRNNKGQMILNPNHRGWTGDFDFGASPVAAKKLEKVVQKIDRQVADAKVKEINSMKSKGYTDSQIKQKLGDRYNKTVADSFPGYTNVDRFEITTNNGGSGVSASQDSKYKLGEPGSSAHQTQAIVDAHSKETYVSVGMEKKQPGKKLVEINDHHKKAIDGLKLDSSEFMDPKNIGKMQGATKGALKSVGANGNEFISNDKLAEVLAKNGVDMNPKVFRHKMELVKSTPELGESLFGNVPSDKLQNTYSDLIDESHKKASEMAEKEFAENKKKIEQIEKTADKLEANGNKAKADELRQKANEFRAKEIDSTVKIDATNDAIDAKLNGRQEVADISRQTKTYTDKIDIKNPKVDVDAPKGGAKIKPNSKIGSKVSNKLGGQVGKKAMGALGASAGVYMKLLDIQGNIEDFTDSVNEALDNEKAGDSEFKTVANATGRMLMKMSGIPAMTDAIYQSHKEAEKKLREDIAKDPNLTDADFQRLLPSYHREADLNLAGQIAKGAVTEAADLPGKTGRFLGKLVSKGDLDKAEKGMKDQDDKLKMFRYRYAKLQELENTMEQLANSDDYNEELVEKKNKLKNYFYDLNTKTEVGSLEGDQVEKWIDKIEDSQDKLNDALKAKLEAKEAQRKKWEEEQKKEDEARYQASLKDKQQEESEFGWSEEDDSDYSDSSDEYDYDTAEYIPDNGEVGTMMAKISHNQSGANSSWQSGNQQGRQAEQEQAQAMAELAAQNQQTMQELSSTMQQIQQTRYEEKKKEDAWNKEKATYDRKIKANNEYQEWLNKVESMGGAEARQEADQFARGVVQDYATNPSGFVNNLKQQAYNQQQQEKNQKAEKQKQAKLKCTNDLKQFRAQLSNMINSCSGKRGPDMQACINNPIKKYNYYCVDATCAKYGVSKNSLSDLKSKMDKMYDYAEKEIIQAEKGCPSHIYGADWCWEKYIKSH